MASQASQGSSEYYFDDDSQLLEAIQNVDLPGDIEVEVKEGVKEELTDSQESEELEPPPPAQPQLKRKYSESRKTIRTTMGMAKFKSRTMRRSMGLLGLGILGRGGQIFKGLSIYINGWTQPSVQELRQLIVEHGGVFQPYLDNKGLVTHIITCSLTPAKIKEFKHMKVARPQWLLESVNAGELLPWKGFQYVPEERDESSQGEKSKQLQSTLAMQSQRKSSSSAMPPPPAPDPLYTSDPKSFADAALVPGYAADISNPNARKAMANPEWRKAHTSVSADFIEGYYKNSRLHHLSTWKSELKDLVHEAQERAEANVQSAAQGGHIGKVPSEGGVSMRGAALLAPKSPSRWKGKGKAVDDQDRVIMHCDFDCFFVSAGLVSRPELKGKPVVVCHSQGGQGGASSTSEIASASYEARAFGIKNGMSLQQGRALCPELVTIPYEFERYKQFSLQFYTVLMSHADDLQAVSVDEALIDVTETVSQLRQQAAAEGSQYDPAKDYAETIRAEVRKVTSCEVSIGIAHNILLARLATRKAKPGGSYHLLPEDVPEYLAPLELSDLHGFGRQTKTKAIDKFGTAKLGELAKKSRSQLIDAFGKATGEKLYNGLRGIDDQKLESDKPRKSVSCEINYGIRFENSEQAEQFIYQMAAEVKKRLDAIDMMGRSITMKIMKRDPTAPVEPAKFLGHGPCDLFSKQGPLIGPGGKATSDDQVIGEFAWRLLQSFNFDPKELRGIGMQITKLESVNAAASAPVGQALLPFKRVESGSNAKAMGTAGPSNARNSKTPAVIAPVPSQVTAKAEVKEDGGFDLPSFSQVDMTVFEALPPSLQKELKDEYSRRRSEAPAAPAPQVGPSRFARPPAIASPSKLGLGRRSGPPPGLFPSKAATKVNVKRITHQLAPHSHSNISPQKSALFALLQKKPKQKTARVTVAKLKDLGIDPEVFAMLPKQIQDEQLVRARLLKERGSIPEVSEERKILKPKKPTLPPGFVVYRAPPPQARYKKRPVLRQQGKTKKEKLAFTEAEDVMDVMEKWVTTYQHWAPREKDVEYLSKFILQNADADNAGDWGVETAVKVMKWWLVLLRRFWAGSEFVDDEQWEDWSDSQEDPVGKAWWETFRKVKAQMDVVARKRFGGCISLK
ncbi:hypothetical protein NMY22_g13908 [Coprinellus aureogranulatus]|nr:hypothetical protein NMY22_g13908 [Coprinellus aureogranulatus]